MACDGSNYYYTFWAIFFKQHRKFKFKKNI